jgi:uncharacterized LabA/DUF88 family protein
MTQTLARQREVWSSLDSLGSKRHTPRCRGVVPGDAISGGVKQVYRICSAGQRAKRGGFLESRVIAYVDGFNLYFGLREAKLRHCYWLDIPKLVRRYLPEHHTLVETKYFTSRVANDPGKASRQSEFLEALFGLPGISPYFGQYRSQKKRCRECKAEWVVQNEKMTDVNIAVQMLSDAVEDRFDLAFLVSADSDLRAPLEAIRRMAPSKRVWVAFPPRRSSVELAKLAHERRILRAEVIEQCLLPDVVLGPDGYPKRRPEKWRKVPPTDSDEPEKKPSES